MKYLDAYRDPHAARELLDEIRQAVTRPWVVLDVCGGQAHNLLRIGADRDLPEGLELVHGPGCPVSATPAGFVDRALALAARPGAIVGAPGELLRVPGARGHETLQAAQARGADVRVVYSPLDALALARKHPDREVIGLAVGFETTAPTAAAAVLEAERLGLDNLALLTSYLRLAPAVEALWAAPGNRARAVLAPGPVAAVTGLGPFAPLVERFGATVVVVGPGPVDLLDGLARAVRRLERGEPAVENQYARAVRPDGNPQAQATIAAVFEPTAARWRGLGLVAASGLTLRPHFHRFDASARYPEARDDAPAVPSSECGDGDVVAGRCAPAGCPAFGTRCTPAHPLGASMVAAEGTCAAYYRFRRPVDPNATPSPGTVPVLPEPAYPGG
jgi:hydrogenase expression/formation protein HypD